MKDIAEKLKNIERVTGIKIDSHKHIRTGGESGVIEVNKTWIFRFPKGSVVDAIMRKRWEFLISFSKVSPIPVPKPEFITGDFIGYRKLAGEPLDRALVEKLPKKNKSEIAKRLGFFLKTLHDYKDRQINFDTGYLVMRGADYLTVPIEIANRLTSTEHNQLASKLRAIANNHSNFKKAKTIIHGDLNFNNILFDDGKRALTGIVDWSDVGFGLPAMDFIQLIDPINQSGDIFLKEILKWYGAKDELHNQIQENAVIDLMNWFWFYEKTGNPKGSVKAIHNLKRFLRKR